jgi:hypothetical protein|tara:strand:+ start:9349 stop:9597 length:249 start_codon:yes stop_codon:yes gene_type:complete
MKADKRKLSQRKRIEILEQSVDGISKNVLTPIISATSSLANLVEMYIEMKGDTENIVNYLEEKLNNEDEGSEKREEEQTEGS